MASFNVALHFLVVLLQATNVVSAQFSGTSTLDLPERAEDPLFHCLQSGLSKHATVETTGESGFLNESIRYATLASPSYKAVAKVASEQDIAVAVCHPLRIFCFSQDYNHLEVRRRIVLTVLLNRSNVPFRPTQHFSRPQRAMGSLRPSPAHQRFQRSRNRHRIPQQSQSSCGTQPDDHRRSSDFRAGDRGSL